MLASREIHVISAGAIEEQDKGWEKATGNVFAIVTQVGTLHAINENQTGSSENSNTILLL